MRASGDAVPDWARARPDYPRSPLAGRLVAVMRLKLLDRGMQLIAHWTRAIRRHDVHELILTDAAAGPGDNVARCAYLGFVEFSRGGVAMSGDALAIDGEAIATLAGFDETHMPNHLNIVAHGAALRTGIERGLVLGASVAIRPVFTPSPPVAR
ncbi:MAG: hypothetical protein FJX57_07950 [Alphaproteobacteria bacterium]|nr:hypothetical protein [Alphaproteobacteria bacterium]